MLNPVIEWKGLRGRTGLENKVSGWGRCFFNKEKATAKVAGGTF